MGNNKGILSLIITWVQVKINSLPNDKILDLSKFQTFADDKIVPTQKLQFFFEE